MTGYSPRQIGHLIVTPFATIGVLSAVLVWEIEHVGSLLLALLIFGGAVVPLLTGMLADLSGSLGIALLLPAACYAIIAYFGYYARRPHASA